MNIVKFEGQPPLPHPLPHKKNVNPRGFKMLFPAFNTRHFSRSVQLSFSHCDIIFHSTFGTDWEILSSDKGCFSLRFKSCAFSFFMFKSFSDGRNQSSHSIHFHTQVMVGGGGGGGYKHFRNPSASPLGEGTFT